MEGHSVDINRRNMPVRLKESNVDETEMNGESVDSLYAPASSENETQIDGFSENFESKCSLNSVVIDEMKEKLSVHQDINDSCGLINGCNKLLHDEMKCVHISVNGLKKCKHFELINTHIDHLNNRTCSDRSIPPSDFRTDTNNDSQIPVNSSDESIPNEIDSPDSKICDQISNNVATNNEHISSSTSNPDNQDVEIVYLGYDSESQMPDIMRLIQKDLSEPYSIYTYRYFIHNWPKLCFLAQHGNRCVGAIVCKLDVHKKHSRRGYIAMLAVDEKYRKRKIGSNLVLKAIDAMVEDNADEVVLETEITNKPALKLYENLGFVRDKRLFRYYLNGVDALRLKLWLR